ncbi:MAG: hypothetical protein LBR74_01590 [Eubacterium sp.]|jgi:hypothetical protein|nr:hypothetical protein [Eubacterium sp.]
MSIKRVSDITKKNSYIPELKRRRNELGNALLKLGDELIAISDDKIMLLFEKHHIEFYNAFLPNDRVKTASCQTYLQFDNESAATITAGTQLTGYSDDAEAVYTLNEDYTVSSAQLALVATTESWRDGYRLLYDKEQGEFSEIGFAMAADSPNNYARLKISADNLFLGDGVVYLSAESVPVLVENYAQLEWKLLLDDIFYPVAVSLEDGQLRLIAHEQGEIGRQSLIIFSGRSVEITSGYLFSPLLCRRGETVADYLIAGGEVQEGEVAPFGSPLHPREEFFVACGTAFGIRGGKVSIRFSVNFDKRYQSFIMPDGCELPKPADCYADRVSIQYFNGDTFVPFPESGRYSGIFAAQSADISIDLTIPHNMFPVEVHGIFSYWIRFFLTDAKCFDYCPVMYHSPLLNDLTIKYDGKIEPVEITCETLYETNDLTGKKSAFLFAPHFMGQDYLYLGLEGKVAAHLNIFIRVSGENGLPWVASQVEVLTDTGYQAVGTNDFTNGWSRTGIMSVSMPVGLKKQRFLIDKDLFILRLPVHNSAGLSTVSDLRINVCVAHSSSPISKGSSLSGDGGLEGLTLCDSSGYLTSYDITDLEDAHFYLSTQERYTSGPELLRAIKTQFPDVQWCGIAFSHETYSIDLYLMLKEGQDTPFSLYCESIGHFLSSGCGFMAPVKCREYLPVIVTLRAACNGISEEDIPGICECLKTYIEDRGLFPPGNLPSGENLYRRLKECGVSVEDWAVTYHSFDGDTYDTSRHAFPYGFARSGHHKIWSV